MRRFGAWGAIRLASVALLGLIAMEAAGLSNQDAGGAPPPRPLFYDRAIRAPDLFGRSLEELRLMRNTIYARSGRRFADPKLRDYFSHQPWYPPVAPGPRKVGAIDIANIQAIAAQEKRLLAEPLTVPCPEAGADGALGDKRLEDRLSNLARRLTWEEYGPPTACHRQVQLSCGPDIDGDGQPESIVHITWRTVLNGKTCGTIGDSNDYWNTGVTFLISGRPANWRAVAPFGVDIDGDQQNMRSYAGFVRRPNGEMAIRSSYSNVASDTGCDFGSYTIWRLRQGKLTKIEDGDDSPPCDAAE